MHGLRWKLAAHIGKGLVLLRIGVKIVDITLAVNQPSMVSLRKRAYLRILDMVSDLQHLSFILIQLGDSGETSSPGNAMLLSQLLWCLKGSVKRNPALLQPLVKLLALQVKSLNIADLLRITRKPCNSSNLYAVLTLRMHANRGSTMSASRTVIRVHAIEYRPRDKGRPRLRSGNRRSRIGPLMTERKLETRFLLELRVQAKYPLANHLALTPKNPDALALDVRAVKEEQGLRCVCDFSPAGLRKPFCG